MKIKFALKAAALAAALAFSGASHAAIDIPPQDMGVVKDVAGKFLHGFEDEQAIATYGLTGSTLGDPILAFCVQPTVEQGLLAVYSQNTAVTSLSTYAMFADNGLDHRATRIQALFEQNYGSLTTSQARLGFALALWDLVADDGDLTKTTGAQYFTVTSGLDYVSGQPIDLVAAQNMLTNTIGAEVHGTYKYTLFTGRSPGSDVDDSQALLSVTAAVPEADTWAMMVLGLGLVGFMARRKSDESEKFAA
jgi:hypothetical protein